MMCAKCLKPMKDLKEVHEHFLEFHSAPGLLQKELKFVNNVNGNTVLEIAQVLAKTGKPVTRIKCVICGNYFETRLKFEGHVCMNRGTPGVKKVALFVSPSRKDATWANEAAKLHGSDILLYKRGIPSEDAILKIFREKGASIIQVGCSTPVRRDDAMLQLCDLAFLFPGDSCKFTTVRERTISVFGVEVKAVAYPDIPIA